MGSTVLWAWGEGNILGIKKGEFAVASYRSSAQLEFQVQAFTDEVGGVRIPKKVTLRSGDQSLFVYELKSVKMNSAGKREGSSAGMDDPGVREWVGLVR